MNSIGFYNLLIIMLDWIFLLLLVFDLYNANWIAWEESTAGTKHENQSFSREDIFATQVFDGHRKGILGHLFTVDFIDVAIFPFHTVTIHFTSELLNGTRKARMSQIWNIISRCTWWIYMSGRYFTLKSLFKQLK